MSPLLANIYLHWFETIVSLTAKACGQVMSIVRYADDFVILARAWADGFLQKVEGILEGRMELTVNRDKTKLLDFCEAHATLLRTVEEVDEARQGEDTRRHSREERSKACRSCRGGTQPLRHVLAQVGECPQGGVIDRKKLL